MDPVEIAKLQAQCELFKSIAHQYLDQAVEGKSEVQVLFAALAQKDQEIVDLKGQIAELEKGSKRKTTKVSN